jgi:transposase InsO family protein
MTRPLNELYRVLGISKQSIHQYYKRQQIFDFKFANLLIEVDELRAQHPGCGVEKMYHTLKPDFIGRDRFVEALMQLGYRVKRAKNYHRTTIPCWYKYPNLIEGLVVTKKNTVWQSDITYFDLNGRFYYLVFIVDVYTRQIVGYAVSDHLRAEANLRALRMALADHGAPRIHHSDRGSQYVDQEYTKLLKDHSVDISMGLQAQDNAYAERINGTIKNEYLQYWNIKTFNELKRKVKRAVQHYNAQRIHDALPERLAPNEFNLLFQKYQVIEEIYAPKRSIQREKLLMCNEHIEESELFCKIN